MEKEYWIKAFYSTYGKTKFIIKANSIEEAQKKARDKFNLINQDSNSWNYPKELIFLEVDKVTD